MTVRMVDGGPFDDRLRERELRLREMADELKLVREGGPAGLEAAAGLEGEPVDLSIVRHVRLNWQRDYYVQLAGMTRPVHRLTWRAWASAVADQVRRRQRSSRPATDAASDLAQRILNTGPPLSADVLRQTVLPQAFDHPNKYWKTRR